MSSKNPKWHSRRYQTSDAHDYARAMWKQKQAEKKERALERQEVASKRTPQEQLARLDKMFGEGQGARKERAKLNKRIEEKELQEQLARSEKMFGEDKEA